MMNKPVYLVHADEYKNWIFDPTHPTQGRRFTNARNLLISMAKAQEIEIVEVLPRLATKTELERVHSPAYINQVLDEHTCVKGKLTKKVTAAKPKCPKGYKVKK